MSLKNQDFILSIPFHPLPHTHHFPVFFPRGDHGCRVLNILSGLCYACTCLYSTYMCQDFAGGLVVKNPPASAGDVGSIPGWGAKILHVVGQLSLPTVY